jgi:uncharacterized protein with PIN domain
MFALQAHRVSNKCLDSLLSSVGPIFLRVSTHPRTIRIMNYLLPDIEGGQEVKLLATDPLKNPLRRRCTMRRRTPENLPGSLLRKVLMTSNPEPSFACDAMLGGLARWLRAAGYDAFWQQGISDQELNQLCQREGRTLLSCDTKLFLCRVLRDNLLPALLVPLRRTPQEQLAYVLAKCNLSLHAPRCMSCGGNLVEVPKATVCNRVPPRTFAWLDQFWECNRCQRIFWHGTHWQRIREQLRQAAASAVAFTQDIQRGK